MGTKQLKYLSGPGPNMLSDYYREVSVGPGLVYPPHCTWTGFGYWGRPGLASAQRHMGRAGKLHGDERRKTFIEKAVRSRDPSPCSGQYVSALTIVPRLALGPTEPGTTHPMPSQGLPSQLDLGPVAAPGDGRAVADPSLSPTQHGCLCLWLWNGSGQGGRALHYPMALQISPGHPQTGCTLEGGSGGEFWCQEPGPSHAGPDLNKSQDLNHAERDLSLSALTVGCGQDHS